MTEPMQAKADILQDEKRYHKGAMRKHRRALHNVNEQLAKLRAFCVEQGILLIESEGKPHGCTDRDN
ncbi:hypothetical protein LCGC14_0746890 [marine sediment metagenome]|uniref:Uncharacterized protein n=1 Tax=marine sediment metagenome TaxID=412755 RepID=A0A0F9TC73_9ZZZZ